jgi:hypothetical protein
LSIEQSAQFFAADRFNDVASPLPRGRHLALQNRSLNAFSAPAPALDPAVSVKRSVAASAPASAAPKLSSSLPLNPLPSTPALPAPDAAMLRCPPLRTLWSEELVFTTPVASIKKKASAKKEAASSLPLPVSLPTESLQVAAAYPQVAAGHPHAPHRKVSSLRRNWDSSGD